GVGGDRRRRRELVPSAVTERRSFARNGCLGRLRRSAARRDMARWAARRPTRRHPSRPGGRHTNAFLRACVMTDVARPPVRWWRLALLATLIVAVFAVGRATGLSTYLSTEGIRALTTT